MDDLVGGEILDPNDQVLAQRTEFLRQLPKRLRCNGLELVERRSVAKCLPGGAENGVAAMVLGLTDNPGYIGASPFGGKLIRRSASAENLEGPRRFILHQYGWFRVGLHPNGQNRR